MQPGSGQSFQSISFLRIINAGAAAIYAAWTNPSSLERWMANQAENELRVGGSYRYEIPGPDDATFIHRGIFLALEPAVVVRQSFAIESEEENPFVDEFIELRLRALGEARTEVTFTNGWADPRIAEEDLSAVEENWQAWFDQLEKYLGVASREGGETVPLRALHILQNFSAPPETLFDAWINPALASRWLFTSGDASPAVKIDARVGGAWSVSETREGIEYRAEGRYLALERPRSLSFTFAMPQFSPNHDEITVDFYEASAGTLLNFTQSGPDIAEELKGLNPDEVGRSETGWRQMFEALERATLLASDGGLR